MQFVFTFLLTLGPLVGVLVLLGVVFLWRYRERLRGRRSPLSGLFLRSPGQSAQNQLEDLRWDLAAYLSLGMLPIPVAIGAYLVSWAFRRELPSSEEASVLVLFVAGFLGWLAWKIWRMLRELRKLRLAYDAELAAGQELNQLLRHNYRVFHDFPVDDRKFNIDHVLVGPGGVFAVETKGRSKPKARSDTATWEVVYDGTTLHFPGWSETKPMQQAESAGAWLRKWLSKAVGEPVKVEPMVVLPGWFVKRKEPGGVAVIASGLISTYFTRRPAVLDELQVERIAHQLEQRCRDVVPLGRRLQNDD